MTTVSEIDPAPALVTLADLTPVHYRESLTLPITSTSPAGPARTAEQWARLVLERAPWKARAQMLTAWGTGSRGYFRRLADGGSARRLPSCE